MSKPTYHDHVATAGFVMNLRTRQICVLYTDYDNVILQLETDSIFPFLLADFQVHFELLTKDVERLADILEDVLDSSDDFELKNLLHCANFFSGCPVRHHVQ